MGKSVVKNKRNAVAHVFPESDLERVIKRVAARCPGVQINVLRREEHVGTGQETIPVQILTGWARGIGREIKIIHVLPEGARTEPRASGGPVVADHVVIGNLGRAVTLWESARSAT